MRSLLAPLVLSSALAVSRALARDTPSEAEKLKELSLEELLDVPIVSASNTSERVSEAPATVIVISRADIQQRGYSELSEVLDDLPGMEIVRPYGATYFKDYWRGYRNTIGDPFLLLVDGLVTNHLYFNTADVLVTLPLSNVERVEVVYGPASSVYGANAFMGVINVITLRDRPRSGTYAAGFLAGGSNGTRLADVNVFYKKDDFRLSLSARIDNGDVPDDKTELYEYTKRKYYADRRLWGGFVDNPNLAGDFLSHRRQRGVDLRAYLGTFELGVLYDRLSSGYGLEYAADESQNNAIWGRPDLSVFLRDRRSLGSNLTISTLVRYRGSDVSNDSTFMESFDVKGPDGRATRVARLSYWQALNTSWSVFSDLELKVNEALSLNGGLKYEQKDLQKAYDTHYGPALPVSVLDASTYPYPTPSFPTPVAQNRITTEDVGVYAQGRYRIGEHHLLNVGLRHDNNSKYGGATTVRGGYVGRFGAFGVKALYGDAFQEPNPRLLYGGWTGSGSDPNLLPEKSRTIEVSGSYQTKRWSALASLYDVRNDRTIVNTAAGASNLGERKVTGFDVHLQTVLDVPAVKQLRLWAYYSRYLRVREKRVDSTGGDLPDGRIGDLANDKVWAGFTALVGDHLTATLRARWVGQRPTVDTNPVGTVPAFTTMDVFVRGSDLLVKGLGLSVKFTNLANETYFEPGVRDASAGTTPGSFDAGGAWHGSGGFYNSLLPQPGRQITVSADFSF